MLAHNRLTNINPVHVTSVTDVAEAEVQITALQAHPVSNALHFRLFGSNFWLNQSLLCVSFLKLVFDTAIL